MADIRTSDLIYINTRLTVLKNYSGIVCSETDSSLFSLYKDFQMEFGKPNLWQETSERKKKKKTEPLLQLLNLSETNQAEEASYFY